MNIKDLRTKHEGELDTLLHEKQGRVQELRFAMGRGEVKNIKELAEVKKDIARILTIKKQQASNKTKQA